MKSTKSQLLPSSLFRQIVFTIVCKANAASTVPLSGLNPNGYCASVITSLLSAHEINLLFKIEVKRFVTQLIKLTERFKQVIVFQLITFQYNLPHHGLFERPRFVIYRTNVD